MQLPAEQVTVRVSRKAAASMVAHRFVKPSAANAEQVALCANNEFALGILGFDALSGQEIEVQAGGHLLIEAYGSIAIGDEIVAGLSGTGTKRGNVATARYNVQGRALTGASHGDLFVIDFRPYTVFGANAS